MAPRRREDYSRSANAEETLSTQILSTQKEIRLIKRTMDKAMRSIEDGVILYKSNLQPDALSKNFYELMMADNHSLFVDLIDGYLDVSCPKTRHLTVGNDSRISNSEEEDSDQTPVDSREKKSILNMNNKGDQTYSGDKYNKHDQYTSNGELEAILNTENKCNETYSIVTFNAEHDQYKSIGGFKVISNTKNNGDETNSIVKNNAEYDQHKVTGGIEVISNTENRDEERKSIVKNNAEYDHRKATGGIEVISNRQNRDEERKSIVKNNAENDQHKATGGIEVISNTENRDEERKSIVKNNAENDQHKATGNIEVISNTKNNGDETNSIVKNNAEYDQHKATDGIKVISNTEKKDDETNSIVKNNAEYDQHKAIGGFKVTSNTKNNGDETNCIVKDKAKHVGVDHNKSDNVERIQTVLRDESQHRSGKACKNVVHLKNFLKRNVENVSCCTQQTMKCVKTPNQSKTNPVDVLKSSKNSNGILYIENKWVSNSGVKDIVSPFNKPRIQLKKSKIDPDSANKVLCQINALKTSDRIKTTGKTCNANQNQSRIPTGIVQSPFAKSQVPTSISCRKTKARDFLPSQSSYKETTKLADDMKGLKQNDIKSTTSEVEKLAVVHEKKSLKKSEQENGNFEIYKKLSVTKHNQDDMCPTIENIIHFNDKYKSESLNNHESIIKRNNEIDCVLHHANYSKIGTKLTVNRLEPIVLNSRESGGNQKKSISFEVFNEIHKNPIPLYEKKSVQNNLIFKNNNNAHKENVQQEEEPLKDVKGTQLGNPDNLFMIRNDILIKKNAEKRVNYIRRNKNRIQRISVKNQRKTSKSKSLRGIKMFKNSVVIPSRYMSAITNIIEDHRKYLNWVNEKSSLLKKGSKLDSQESESGRNLESCQKIRSERQERKFNSENYKTPADLSSRENMNAHIIDVDQWSLSRGKVGKKHEVKEHCAISNGNKEWEDLTWQTEKSSGEKQIACTIKRKKESSISKDKSELLCNPTEYFWCKHVSNKVTDTSLFTNGNDQNTKWKDKNIKDSEQITQKSTHEKEKITNAANVELYSCRTSSENSSDIIKDHKTISKLTISSLEKSEPEFYNTRIDGSQESTKQKREDFTYSKNKSEVSHKCKENELNIDNSLQITQRNTDHVFYNNSVKLKNNSNINFTNNTHQSDLIVTSLNSTQKRFLELTTRMKELEDKTKSFERLKSSVAQEINDLKIMASNLTLEEKEEPNLKRIYDCEGLVANIKSESSSKSFDFIHNVEDSVDSSVEYLATKVKAASVTTERPISIVPIDHLLSTQYKIESRNTNDRKLIEKSHVSELEGRLDVNANNEGILKFEKDLDQDFEIAFDHAFTSTKQNLNTPSPYFKPPDKGSFVYNARTSLTNHTGEFTNARQTENTGQLISKSDVGVDRSSVKSQLSYRHPKCQKASCSIFNTKVVTSTPKETKIRDHN